MVFALPQLALCWSIVLLNGVSTRANTHTALDPGFLQCKDCFFRGTPPGSLSEVGLEQRCHRQLTGRPFASLFNNGCQSTVYTAFHLSQANGWGRGEHNTQDAKEPIDDDSHVAIPALYAETPSSSSSALLKWDAVTAGLIRISVMPACSKTSGEMYVQNGVGRLNECGGKVLWSAVCCAASDGKGSFSIGLVMDGEMRVVSIKALEELIGVAGLFSGGCVKEGDHSEDFMSLIKEEMKGIKTPSSDAQSENAQSENAPETTTSDSDDEEVASQRVYSEDQSTSSLDLEKDLQDSTNETSESVILQVLSSTISLLYLPFSPIVNRVINFPSQVAYVLQEDLAVLTSVPGDSVTLVTNLGSGVSSGVSCVFNTLYETGEVTTCTIYSCISPLVSGLFSSLFLVLQEGFVGTGTLVWDVLGFLMGTVGCGIKICWMVLGSVLDQMVDYLCLVTSELGNQVSTAGCGVGKLTLRSGKGVVNLLRIVMHIVWGVAENTAENVQESWGGSSIVESPEVPPPLEPTTE